MEAGCHQTQLVPRHTAGTEAASGLSSSYTERDVSSSAVMFYFSLPPAVFQGLNSPSSGQRQRLLITGHSRSSRMSGPLAFCSQRSSPMAGSHIQVRISQQLCSRTHIHALNASAHPGVCSCTPARTHAPRRPIWLLSLPACNGFNHFLMHVASHGRFPWQQREKEASPWDLQA